ncbi:MAG: hypothetical protein AAFX06_27595 [Planctomycetota bacterium]
MQLAVRHERYDSNQVINPSLLMKAQEDFYDALFEETFPWREYSPEEFAARHWFEFGACTIARTQTFHDPDMHQWAIRFEEIFHSPALIEECRRAFLTPSERAEQDARLKRMDQQGF